MRGMCTLMGGLIQVLQHSFVKGIYNVLKSWIWIKHLPEALDFVGKERQVVRSAALFTLGIFNILLSLLPPAMISTATFLSGFTGDRQQGLGMLHKCWKDEGMLSPWAALVWAAYHVDTKTFIGERQTPKDFQECKEIFDWARDRYAHSVFFSGIEADYYACQKQVRKGVEITESAAQFVGDLKALEWALHYKRGVYQLTDLQFAKSGRSFEASIEVYVKVGRRSMVPFMAMYAALCYLVVADQKGRQELVDDDISVVEDDDQHEMDAAAAAAHAEEMLALVRKYEALDKKNWGRQDQWAFKVAHSYDMHSLLNDCQVPAWPLLDLVDSMILRMRCTRWMDDTQAADLLELMKSEHGERVDNVDEEIRLCAYFSEILLEREQHQAALEWCDKGLLLKDDISSRGAKEGFAPLLLYLKALNMYQRGHHLTANYCLKTLESFGKDYWIYNYVVFKSSILKKQVATAMEEGYFENAVIPAGESKKLVFEVSTQGTAVDWDWTCMNHDISYSVFFRDIDGETSLVQSGQRRDSSEGPLAGFYLTPDGGHMIFEFDNKYSMWRSKDIVYRISLAKIE